MIHAPVVQVRNLKVVTVRWSNFQVVLLEVQKRDVRHLFFVGAVFYISFCAAPV
jgi:hypothetical protein